MRRFVGLHLFEVAAWGGVLSLANWFSTSLTFGDLTGITIIGLGVTYLKPSMETKETA